MMEIWKGVLVEFEQMPGLFFKRIRFENRESEPQDKDGTLFFVLRPADLAEILKLAWKWNCRCCRGSTKEIKKKSGDWHGVYDLRGIGANQETRECHICRGTGLNSSLPICAQVAEAMGVKK